MKRVVSVSLGSSKRDSTSEVEILGEEFEISRDRHRRRHEALRRDDARARRQGGRDRPRRHRPLRLGWTDRRYTVRDADRLARIAKITPVVDGSGVKNTLERKTIEYLQDNGIVDFADKKGAGGLRGGPVRDGADDREAREARSSTAT